MALNYQGICENEEFLTHIGADQLFSLLSRDDLNAPSETFVFNYVIKWIKHKDPKMLCESAFLIPLKSLPCTQYEKYMLNNSHSLVHLI